VRKTGFKPFVGPALSSGSYPIIATLSGKWHYSATFLGRGIYRCKRIDCKNQELKLKG